MGVGDSKKVPNLLRLQNSMGFRDDLDAKYSLDKLANIDTSKKDKDKDNKAAVMHQETLDRSQILDQQGQIVVAPITSLLTSGTGKNVLDKYFQNKLLENKQADGFDTVIVDDASLMDETEVI